MLIKDLILLLEEEYKQQEKDKDFYGEPSIEIGLI